MGLDLISHWYKEGSKQFRAEDKGILLKSNSSYKLVYIRSHCSELIDACGIRIWPDFCSVSESNFKILKHVKKLNTSSYTSSTSFVLK